MKKIYIKSDEKYAVQRALNAAGYSLYGHAYLKDLYGRDKNNVVDLIMVIEIENKAAWYDA